MRERNASDVFMIEYRIDSEAYKKHLGNTKMNAKTRKNSCCRLYKDHSAKSNVKLLLV